jgi:hypothetical protein
MHNVLLPRALRGAKNNDDSLQKSNNYSWSGIANKK